MALSILQNNLGVTNSTCSYTDYPDHPLNFFPKDLRSTAYFGGGQWSSRWGVAVYEDIEELHVKRVVGFIAHWMVKYYAKLNGLTAQSLSLYALYFNLGT